MPPGMELALRSITFYALAASLAHASWRVAGLLLHGRSLAERLLASAVSAAALVSLIVLALGLAGALRLPALLLVQLAVWVAVLRWARDRVPASPSSGLAQALHERTSDGVFAALVGLAAVGFAWVAWQGLFRTDWDYDTLTNHLFAPARWISSGEVGLIDTPFGAPTAAYEPMTTELFYTWLMLPFHSDLLARAGQLAHFAVLQLAVYAICRRLGLGRAAAALAPLGLYLVVPLVKQASGAMTDLALAAWWMTSLAAALRWREHRDAGSASMLALALGLFAGTKYVAVAFLPVLIATVVALSWLRSPVPIDALRLPRLVTLGGVAAALLLGTFWYGRNLIETANPLFPLRIELGGHELFSGAFGREQLEAWVFNRRVPGLTLRHFAEQLGASLGRGPEGSWYTLPYVPLILFVAAWGAACFRPAVRAAALVLLASVVVAMALAWLVLPSHAPRFVLAPLALWAVAAAIVASSGRVAAFVVLGALVIHASLSGAHDSEFLPSKAREAVGLAVFAVALVVAGRFLNRRRGLALVSGIAAIAGIVTLVLADVQSESIRARAFEKWAAVGEAWAWMDANASGARIAYAGHNVPYFLLGPHFENEVFHARVAEQGGSYHDYVERFAPLFEEPYTPEPAYERMEVNEAAWLGRLQELQTDYLWVAALPWNERVNHRHSREGFIVEDVWARGQPELFRPVFTNPAVHVYEVRLDAQARQPSPPMRREEIDAVELYLKDPALLDRHYPGARAFIESTRVGAYARARNAAR